jgi:hypothetical protein
VALQPRHHLDRGEQLFGDDHVHVYQDFNVDGKVGFENLKFDSSFAGLTSVAWLQGDCITNMPHMFDNVVAEVDVKK